MRFLVLLVILGMQILCENSLHAQSMFLNPSFEGNTGTGIVPPNWDSCGVTSTPDTQPGQFGVTLAASQGNTYVGVVCRANNTWESFTQAIAYPLDPDSCYSFTIDLARSLGYSGYNTPAVLECWGGNASCAKVENLWTSPTISNTSWMTYSVQMEPSASYTYITFGVYYSSATPYNGNVLIDNISPVSTYGVNIDLGNDTTLCSGDTLILDAGNPGANYTWQDGSTDSTFTVFSSGLYYVEVVNNCGTDQDTIIVDYEQFPIVSLGQDTSLCEGDQLLLDASFNNASYIWQDGSSDSVFTVNDSGMYWVNVSNFCGIDNDTILVSYINYPNINLGADTTLCIGLSLMLDAYFLNSSYLWQDNSSSSFFDVEGDGIYSVTVSNECGFDIDSIEVSYLECYCIVYFPNVFTPNEDGINDIFKPLTECEISNFELSVFNRWGEILYTSNDLNEGWKGFSNEKPLSQGVYAWIAKYKDKDGVPVTKVGHVNLLY